MRFYTVSLVMTLLLTSYTAMAVTFTPETRRSFEGEPFAVKFKLSKDAIASGEPVLAELRIHQCTRQRVSRDYLGFLRLQRSQI